MIGNHRGALAREGDVARDGVLKKLPDLGGVAAGGDAFGGVERLENILLAGRAPDGLIDSIDGCRHHLGFCIGIIPCSPRAAGRSVACFLTSWGVGAGDYNPFFFISLSALVLLRLERGVKFRHDRRARNVERLVKVFNERNGPPAHETQLHVLPIVIGLVFHDGPALQHPLFVGLSGRQDEPVARTPDRRFDHVADADVPFARAVEMNFHGLLVLVARPGDGGQRAVEFVLEAGIVKDELVHAVEFERADAPVGDEIEERFLEGLGVGLPPGDLLFLDAEHRAGKILDPAGAGIGQRDLRAAQLVEQIAERRVVADVHLKTAERLFQRVLRGIGHDADVAAVEVLQDEALEDVVNLSGLEAQLRRAVALDGPLVLEIADAARKENNLFHGHIAVAVRRRGLRGEVDAHKQ